MYPTEETLAFKLLLLLEVIHKTPEKELKELGITYGNYISLRMIYDEEGITQAGLAARQHKDRNVIGQVVDKLEKKKYIRRVGDENDRRIYRLYLTEDGRQAVECNWEEMLQGETKLLQRLTEDENQLLKKLLDKMLEPEKTEQSGMCN